MFLCAWVSINLGRSRDGTVFVCSSVTLASFSSLWPAFTLHITHCQYNESIRRKEEHASSIKYNSVKNIDFIDFGNLEMETCL